MFEIKSVLDLIDNDNDFAAVGGYRNNQDIFHSVVVIRFKKQLSQFHYTGSEIKFEDATRPDSFYKITSVVSPKLIPALIGMCNNIKKRANPSYGFFYGGEFYDAEGNHFSEKPIGEVMTCVGFCLNVLKGFLRKDYIAYRDWDSSSVHLTDYLNAYAISNGISVDKIIGSHRRITPLEFLTSGYFDNPPIGKADIDFKSGEVHTEVMGL